MKKNTVLSALALALAVLCGGCAPTASTGESAKDSTSEQPTTEPDTEPEPEEEPAPTPDPAGTYTSSCDYVLGDFTSMTKTGYRFIADAQIKNAGNIGTVYKVHGVWFLSGGGKVTGSKQVRLQPGKRARVGITVPVNNDQLDRHQALGYDSPTCKVRVEMVDTFGEAQ